MRFIRIWIREEKKIFLFFFISFVNSSDAFCTTLSALYGKILVVMGWVYVDLTPPLEALGENKCTQQRNPVLMTRLYSLFSFIASLFQWLKWYPLIFHLHSMRWVKCNEWIYVRHVFIDVSSRDIKKCVVKSYDAFYLIFIVTFWTNMCKHFWIFFFENIFTLNEMLKCEKWRNFYAFCTYISISVLEWKIP